jgi:hypothetical protein
MNLLPLLCFRLDGGIILKWLFKTWNWGGMDWIDQDRERWWVLVNAVMNPRVPSNMSNSLTS